MALSGISLDGKQLTESELKALPKDLYKTALRQTSAQEKREMAAEFAQAAADLRAKAQPYLNQADIHDRKSYRATMGVSYIYERDGCLGKAGRDLRTEAIRQDKEMQKNLSLARPFSAQAATQEQAARVLQHSARADSIKAALHRAVYKAKSAFHLA